MRCEEVQELMPEYIDNQLPEVTARRIDHHVAACHRCRSEYSVWTESGNWIRAEKEQYATSASTRSIVDAVMQRILSEEKWAIPIGKKVFTLTARMRRFSLTAAALLLMVCTFQLYTNTPALEVDNLVVGGEVVAVNVEKSPQVISSSIQSNDGTYIVEAEPVSAESVPESKATTASLLPIEGEAVNDVADEPNYSVILSFFGILVTVLTLSWITRA